MDRSTFPLCKLPCVLCICMSLLWLAADSFRCSTSSCSLINALTVQEGNFISGSAATDWLPIRHACEEEETRCSSSQTIPNSIIVGSSPEWEVWPFMFYFVFLWLPSCWWMWQKYTAVTVHDSTPLHKILVGMSFKSNLSCILSAHRATEPSLRCWVMMSCLANHPGDGKMENKCCWLKMWEDRDWKRQLGCFWCAGWKHVVLLAVFVFFFLR